MVRYLAKTLASLICSECTVSISKEFADLIRRKCVLNIYKLVSFDVKSPLETTINVILRRIYADKEISANAQVKDMKDRALQYRYALHNQNKKTGCSPRTNEG